jgi:hypothetical protein
MMTVGMWYTSLAGASQSENKTQIRVAKNDLECFGPDQCAMRSRTYEAETYFVDVYDDTGRLLDRSSESDRSHARDGSIVAHGFTDSTAKD